MLDAGPYGGWGWGRVEMCGEVGWGLLNDTLDPQWRQRLTECCSG